MNQTIHPADIEELLRMAPEQRLQMVADLCDAEIRLRMAGLRLANPDWPDDRLEREAWRSLLYAA